MQGALLAAALALFAAGAAATDAAVSMDVPAGESKAIRLRNLPPGASLAVRVVSNGKLLVALVGPGKQALFRGSLERTLAFRVRVRNGGDHFLVLNNRAGSEMRAVRTDIRAAPAPRAPPPGERYSPRPEKASWSLSESSIASSPRRMRECAASARRCASE